MKNFLFGLFTVVGGSCCLLSIGGATAEDTIRPHTSVGPIEVGGLTPTEAARSLRIWWETQKRIPLKVMLGEKPAPFLPSAKPGDLGVTLDDVASVQSLPLLSSNSGTDQGETYPLLFRANGLPLTTLEKAVDKQLGSDHPARVLYRKGAIYRKPEVSGAQLDVEGLVDVVGKAVVGDGKVVLPIRQGEKHVSDVDLKKIKDVVAQFSTRFSSRNRPRSANIKLAAEKIDGQVLLPGEKFSFNGTVGKRTLDAGFRLAGVYINGQHDTGVGGGICQVSTTLYNSALLANLKIRSRSNHSLPVPYVPLGRDATVDYGNLDLVFENSYDTPIALSAKYSPGRLTFWILGEKQKGLSVKVMGEGFKSWKVPPKEVVDATLPVGTKKVIREGSIGRSIRTYRLVYQDGKLVKREPLGYCQYGGDSRVIAIGAATPDPTKAIPPDGTADSVVTPPIGRPTAPRSGGG